jgi:large exoprotein involved in heme utilization and adhesion
VIWQDLQTHALLNEKVSGSQKEVNLISETPSAIAEAQGLVINADGTITLVAQAPTTTPHNSSLTPVSCPVTQN